MNKRNIDGATLAEMFRKGMDRKMMEREFFSLRALENPEKYEQYMELADYVDMDYRYYRMASLYYDGCIDELDNGMEEDLLLLTGVSEVSPRMYAIYLREVEADSREDEKITHKALVSLKDSIRRQLGVKK